MNDPLITRFAQAAAADGPLDLRIELAGGGVLAEGSVGQPFTLVGRDDACDVTLSDPDVNPRHAWLQVIGGRVFAIDLGSRTGLVWPDGASGSGWLDAATPVKIGPFHLTIRIPAGRRAAPFDPGYNPLQSDATLGRTRPAVNLDFRNGKRAKDRWSVNRLITLVGRSPECKIHLNADDIAAYHCGLVLTPAGLWVVDLSGRGVVVSGERMRVAPLPNGAELWVGRFLIGCHYPDRPPGAPPAPAAARSDPTTPEQQAAKPAGEKGPARPGSTARTLSDTAVMTGLGAAEDEVPLGVQPPPDPAGGMPSSHIMADAFRALVGFGQPTGPVSGSLSVTSGGSGVIQPPPETPPPPRPDPEAVAAAEGVIVPLIRQLGEMHGQMFDQLQQSVLLMMQMFGQAHRDQMAAMRAEIGRIQELNRELTRLQAEVARLAMAQAFGKEDDQTELELPALPEGPARPDTTAAMQDWVVERINTLQRERQSRWEKLVGTLTGQPPPG